MAICASFSLRAAAACAFSRTLCCRPVPAIELSSCRPGLSAPAWKEYARKNPQEAILDRPAQGCRKKRIHRRNGGHGIGRGHSAPHPIKAVGKKRIYCWGGIQRIAPRSSFSAGTAAMGSAAEPEPASAVSDEVSTAPAAACGAAASACDPSCEALDPQHSVSQPVNPQTIPLRAGQRICRLCLHLRQRIGTCCSLFEIV